MPPRQLLLPEEQEDPQGAPSGEQILQALQEAYPAQGNQIAHSFKVIKFIKLESFYIFDFLLYNF
jgi:hypothetical protein